VDDQPGGQPGTGLPGGSTTGTARPDEHNNGTTRPAGQAGQTSSVGSSEDNGKNRSPDPDSLWERASNHYQPKIKKLEDELADYRKRFASEQAKAKSAEQLAGELEQARKTEDKRAAMVAEFAESRKKALPEHLRGIIDKSAGGDPFKQLELLPEFEDLARRTQLKTIGGNSGGSQGPQIDYAAIRQAQENGDARPLQEAIAKHGQKAYNDGLQRFMAERGR
jgi:hypothetical protein